MAERATDDPIEATINLESYDPEGITLLPRRADAIDPESSKELRTPKGETIYVLMQILQKADRYTHMWIDRPTDASCFTSSGPGEVTQNTSARTFAELDEIVIKGKATFHEVAEALTEIHDHQLFKEQYGKWASHLEVTTNDNG
jgi:hypothetical protein